MGGATEQVKSCIQNKFGYSGQCVECFGALNQCSKDNCMWKCMANSEADACKSCVTENCTPKFEECTGFNLSEEGMSGEGLTYTLAEIDVLIDGQKLERQKLEQQ